MNSYNTDIKNKNNFSMLQLIPKYEQYAEYEMQVYIKLPKMAKFNIGNRYIENILETLENIYLISKINKEERLLVINKIDAYLSYQRSILRVMYKSRYIDEKKFNVGIRYLSDIGAMVGAYIKRLI